DRPRAALAASARAGGPHRHAHRRRPGRRSRSLGARARGGRGARGGERQSVRAARLRRPAARRGRGAGAAGRAPASLHVPRQGDRGRQARGIPRARRRQLLGEARLAHRQGIPRRQGHRDLRDLHLPAPENQASPRHPGDPLMTPSQHKPSTRFLALLLCVALVAGCATSPAFTEGQRMVESGNVEAGLARIEETLKNDPDNLEIRNYYERHKAVAVQRYLSAGDAALSRGSLEQAEASYRQAQRLAPDSVRAREGIVAVEKERNVAARVAEAQALFQAGDLDAAYAKAKEVLAESPKQREAKALARAVEEKRHRADAASPKLNAA